jgi:hypothetical protein
MGVLDGILKSREERKQSAQAAAVADPIIERLVAKTDRRLALARDYRQALRAPVVAARERVAALIARIPGPVEISPGSWSAEAAVRPLFSHAEDAAAAYSGDPGVQAFFAAHPASDCFGMLALRQDERRVLGIVQQGDLQAEVARTTMSFADPQVLAPAPGDAAVREELAIRALEYLALRGMERVGSMRVERRGLEKDVALLRAQVELARRRGTGFGRVASPLEPSVGDAATLEKDLARTVGELEQVASKNLLPALLEEILAAFANPEEHLTIEPCTFALDAMNFVVPASPVSVTPCVATLNLAGRGPFAVTIGRFPRAALRAPQDRLAEAARYL